MTSNMPLQVEGNLYHYPVLSHYDAGFLRSPGPGLGNLLFPLSRAIIGAQLHGGALIYPTMRQIKVGTLLRRERDNRTYGNILRPRTIAEWRDWITAKRLSKTDEQKFVQIESHSDKTLSQQTIQYRGMGRYFHDLQGNSHVIRAWIDDNAIFDGTVDEPYDIGIHVRLGDFLPESNQSDHHSVRQSLDWYSEAYSYLIKTYNLQNCRTFLFTDEDPEGTAQSLNIENLELDPANNAITSISNLSKARYIITSRSTFSMWAVYLGQANAVWGKSFNFEKSMPARPGRDIIL